MYLMQYCRVKGGVGTPSKRVKDDGKNLPWLTCQPPFFLWRFIATYFHPQFMFQVNKTEQLVLC